MNELLIFYFWGLTIERVWHGMDMYNNNEQDIKITWNYVQIKMILPQNIVKILYNRHNIQTTKKSCSNYYMQ